MAGLQGLHPGASVTSHYSASVFLTLSGRAGGIDGARGRLTTAGSAAVRTAASAGFAVTAGAGTGAFAGPGAAVVVGAGVGATSADTATRGVITGSTSALVATGAAAMAGVGSTFVAAFTTGADVTATPVASAAGCCTRDATRTAGLTRTTGCGRAGAGRVTAVTALPGFAAFATGADAATRPDGEKDPALSAACPRTRAIRRFDSIT